MVAETELRTLLFNIQFLFSEKFDINKKVMLSSTFLYRTNNILNLQIIEDQ